MGIFSKSCLGIDVGAASIKVVEISASGSKRRLENYAEFALNPGNELKSFQDANMLLLSDTASDFLRAILGKSKIKEKKAAFSLPDFSTFFTVFSLPPMSKSEVEKAVEFEARHHIPLPISEVTFDWQIIDKKEILPGVKLKILMVAIPNKVLNSYQKVASLTNLELRGMEAEIFGLIRSITGNNGFKEPVCLVDIGWQSTTVGIVKDKSLRVNYTFDISGNNFTNSIVKNMNLSFNEAEEMKVNHGLDPKKEELHRALLPDVNSLSLEVERICHNYEEQEKKKIKRIILSGGSSSLFGLKEYLEGKTKKEVSLIDPFKDITTPPELKSRLKEIGPSFSVAVGVALMGLEASK